MDFEHTEAQQAVRDLARKLFRDHATRERLAAVDATDDRFDAELWRKLATAGLLGTAIPERHDGSDHGLLELCSLLAEAGAAAAPIPLWPTLMLGALPIAQFGNDELRGRILPGVAGGTTILTAALTETGSLDPMQPETTARGIGGGDWEVSGAKVCVAAGHLAHHILIPARTEDGSIGVFLIDPSADGVARERQITTTGDPMLQLTLRRARVPARDVLAAPPDGAVVLDWLIQRAQVGLCALELGVTERALRMTAKYTSERQQFDRPIATFQAVGQRAADAYIDVEAIRLTTWEAAWRLAEGLPASRQVAIAKFTAAEAGHRVVYAAQHLHGGIGFDRDYPLHRYYLLSRQIELTLGSATVQLARLGAELARGE